MRSKKKEITDYKAKYELAMQKLGKVYIYYVL